MDHRSRPTITNKNRPGMPQDDAANRQLALIVPNKPTNHTPTPRSNHTPRFCAGALPPTDTPIARGSFSWLKAMTIFYLPPLSPFPSRFAPHLISPHLVPHPTSSSRPRRRKRDPHPSFSNRDVVPDLKKGLTRGGKQKTPRIRGVWRCGMGGQERLMSGVTALTGRPSTWISMA